MVKPLILALDVTTRTGWALGRDGERPTYGVWPLGSLGNGGLGRVASCLANGVTTMLREHRPAEVIVEAPIRQKARDSQLISAMLMGLPVVVAMICFEHYRRTDCYSAVFAATARKLVLGRGHATKDAIIDWCHAQGWEPQDDNAADALLTLRYKHLCGRMRVMAGAGSV